MSAATNNGSRTRGYKKKERTRRRLIAAAIEVIAEHGEAFSVSDVVARADVANGTFYNYFTDRDALVDAVVPEMLTTFTDELAAAVAEADPAQRFATITAMVLRHAATAPRDMRALLRIDAIQEAMGVEGPLGHLRADLAAGVEAGCFTIVDDDAALDVVVGTLVMAARRIVDHGPNRARDQAVVQHLLRSLGLPNADATAAAERAFACGPTARGPQAAPPSPA